jgi:pyruvate carboxylase
MVISGMFLCVRAFSISADIIPRSVLPTRYFLGKPKINEEMSIEIEQGKMLIIKLLAIGTLDTKKGTRECFFEMNGEVSAVVIDDRDAAIEHVTREKATSDPGSVGSPMVSYLPLVLKTRSDSLLPIGWCRH